nr:hypothetical protein [Moritella viscosa]SHN97352.1 Transporter [Moritella viscosa]
MTTSTTIDSRWSSEFKYVLAAAGAAVGLGNLWHERRLPCNSRF